MAKKKPIPLVGRLAIQLKMLTSAEVDAALAKSASSGNPRLAQVFLEMGLLDRVQVKKLQHVHNDLVEKHRAKKEARTAGSAPARPAKPAQPVGSGTPVGSRASAADAPSTHDVNIHAAAEHAASAASPMTSHDVEALREAPPEQPLPIPSGASERPVAEPTSQSSVAAAPDSVTETPTPVSASVAASTPSSPPAVPENQASPETNIESDEDDYSLLLRVPEPDSSDRTKLEEILASGVANHASDIHLHAGGALKQRINGEFVVTDESIDSDAIERMVAAALTPEQRAILGRDGELDFCLELPGVGRFRANAYRQQRGLDVVFRTIPNKPPTLEELGLPEDLKKYTDFHQGMVLITGPAGCGKSATLAALVNHINEQRSDHILTVEDPIEILHPSKNCLVNQRHAGHHTSSFARALRAALREDPDIIVIGELRDLETISLAMTAAETGHFVLATLHTANAVRTVNRMIGAFPSNEQDQVRAMLSESLRAVISQRLVPTVDGQSRVPALEILVINRAIGNLIRDEKTVQIRSSMQTGRSHGMYLLEQSLNNFVTAGTITREVALELAEEKKLITAGV
jgi:twitching motility protein PilT